MQLTASVFFITASAFGRPSALTTPLLSGEPDEGSLGAEDGRGGESEGLAESSVVWLLFSLGFVTSSKGLLPVLKHFGFDRFKRELANLASATS